MSALLEARKVTKVFGGGIFDKATTTALDDFSFAIHSTPPRVTAVVGESGSGKTTLARLLLGLVTPTIGQVIYNGHDLANLPKSERRAFLRDVQMIFQDPYEVYNPFYKVDHVLETPIAEFNLARTPEARRALIRESLQAVGLRPEETLGRYPHQLSGGQRQRIMVARAVLMRPRLIIADEPVSMVDASLRATILESLARLNREFGMSIVYITHDLTTAYQISDDIIVLYRGRVAEAGGVSRVVRQPHHPYTQLLIQSVPQPDPNHAWGSLDGRIAAEPVVNTAEPVVNGATNGNANGSDIRAVSTTANSAVKGHVGCAFADRCPYVMPMCRETTPPLFQIESGRAATCFLYREHPALPSEKLDEVMNEIDNATV